MEQLCESGSWSPSSENLMDTHYPLHKACRDGDLESLSALMSGANIDLYQEDGYYGWTPIHWAAYFGKLACLRKLVIERNVGLDCVTTKFSQTPLHLASQSGHPHCVQWLIQSGANTQIQDYMGETAIHKSARTGNMECVSLLISQGTKLCIRNHNGQTPSQLAVDSGHQECAAYIERAAQIEQAQGVYEPRPVINPSTDLRSTEQNGRVVTNGNVIQEDDEMDTDMSDLPNGYQTGTKRSRESCEEEQCKKSRRDATKTMAVENNNVISSYQAVLCISTSPLDRSAMLADDGSPPLADDRTHSLFM